MIKVLKRFKTMIKVLRSFLQFITVRNGNGHFATVCQKLFLTSVLKRFKVVPLENVVSRVGNGQHLKTDRPLQTC
jgi:hypothetical protein